MLGVARDAMKNKPQWISYILIAFLGIIAIKGCTPKEHKVDWNLVDRIQEFRR